MEIVFDNLKDAFLICGPEEMILGCIEALAFFGVSKDKIIYELFTTPVNLGVEKEKNNDCMFLETSLRSRILIPKMYKSN